MSRNRNRKGFVLLILLILLAAACARHVVVERERSADLNDNQWTVKSEPVKD